jgi:asparagine synthase (glutamine-hydrolysing)
MCGIIGITGENIEKINKTELSAMLFSLAKRGPDDNGLISFPSCILGQTRLSIIDLSTGNQPMKDNARDFAITFNGEIYNYLELKKTLEEKGHRFSTTSDTEVILKAYAEYGEDCPKYLDGMFAFAIWDNEKKLLFIARDRFGKKPFYYAYDEDKNFIFASEIKAILASGRIKPVLDYGAIDNYLALMYVPPNKSIYKNIFTLSPSESAVFKNGQLTKKKYWELTYSPFSISYGDAKEEIRRLFTDAIKKRMIADVEIGSFLSGGVDSTLVTAYAQKFSSHPIKTFAFGYDGENSELPFAKEASQKIGTDHYELHGEESILRPLKRALAYFDEPHADSSDFPQMLLSEFAGKKVKVALTGDGADELFMGYGWYTRNKYLSYKAHTFEKLFLDPFEGYIQAITIFKKSERKRLWGNTGYVRNSLDEHPYSKTKNHIADINRYDLSTYLPGQLMVKSDRMAMMNSLEVRSPFLDHHLAEFAFNLPTEYKIDGQSGKKQIKELLLEIMPEKFVHRKKRGFGAPVEEWLREPEVKNFIYENILKKDCSLKELFGNENFKDFFIGFYEKNNADCGYKSWMLLCLELWLETHS